ncbi:MAG: hypothetical protein E7373_00645 [Clostridiales bacterium]|nr:hypothetical protein [Clostridiales bacterium]
MKKVIRKIFASKKKYSLSQNLTLTSTLNNVVIEKDKISSSYTLSTIGKKLPDNKMLCSYLVGGRYFVYTEDNLIWECKDNYAIPIGEVNSRPTIISFMYQGEEKILVANNDEDAILVSSNGYRRHSFFSVDKMILHAGRLFSTLNNEISFTTLYDFDDAEINFTPDGTIVVPKKYGNIVYLSVLDGKLYVFTEKAVFYILCDGESIDFKLKTLENVCAEFIEGMISKVNDRFMFIEKGRLYQLYNGTISSVKTLLDNGFYEVCGESANFNGKYLLPVVGNDGKKGIFLYDTFDKTQAVIECNDAIICDGGFVFEQGKVEVAKLVDGNHIVGVEKSWKTDKVDLGSAKDKIINKIYLCSKGVCLLRVSGKFGQTTFNVEAGKNIFVTNLPSSEYEFMITTDSLDFGIRDLQVEFREMEK